MCSKSTRLPGAGSEGGTCPPDTEGSDCAPRTDAQGRRLRKDRRGRQEQPGVVRFQGLREKKFIRPIDVRSSASQGLFFLVYSWENRRPMRWWPWPRALSSQAVVRLWTLLCLMPEIWLFPWSQLPLAEEPESHPRPLLPKPATPRGSLVSSY